MTIFLFGLLGLLFVIDAPIAVAIGAATAAAFLVGGDVSLMVVAQRMYGGADSFPLMAVPLFMIAGLIMEKGGISRRIVSLADSLVGWLPGGLAAVSVVAAMFFAGISGSAAADTAAVGAILIPAMIRNRYSPEFAAAVQASGGSIGVIIPPSIPMIIFGALTGASIGRLFAAGILPGLLMGVSLIAVAVFLSKKKGLGRMGGFSLKKVLSKTKKAGWAIGAPVIILGGIMGGAFTATESAAVAVIYALAVGLFVYREIRFKELPELIINGCVTASVIMFIIVSAQAFSWLLAMREIPQALAAEVLALTTNPVLLLLLINLLLLIAGTFIETTAAIILFVPVILPMLPSLGIDLIQLGVIIVANLAIGMLTPPLGVCLIVAGPIAGSRLDKVSRAVLPFLLVLILDLLLISFYPPLTGLLPGLMK